MIAHQRHVKVVGAVFQGMSKARFDSGQRILLTILVHCNASSSGNALEHIADRCSFSSGERALVTMDWVTMSSAGSQRVHAIAGCMSPARARAHLFCSRRQPAYRRPVTTCMAHKITVLPGDGIGPEITKVALNALEAAGKLENEEFQFSEELVGGAAIDATGKPLPEQTLKTCKQSDAVLLAAIGG